MGCVAGNPFQGRKYSPYFSTRATDYVANEFSGFLSLIPRPIDTGENTGRSVSERSVGRQEKRCALREMGEPDRYSPNGGCRGYAHKASTCSKLSTIDNYGRKMRHRKPYFLASDDRRHINNAVKAAALMMPTP